MQGLIVKGIAGFYYVKTENGVFRCKARGIFKKDGVKPMVGDAVDIEAQGGGDAVIIAIGVRKNEFIRPPVSNVDCFIIVVSAAKPEPNFRIIDSFLTMVEKNGAKAIVCVNKTDIADAEKISAIGEIYENIYPVVKVCALSGNGTGDLKGLLSDGKYALAGPSGTGKSTLLNALTPSAVSAETGEISRKTSRGKHTTRHVEIFETGFGAMLFDTPGFTSFDASGLCADEMMFLYPEIAELYGTCRYKSCVHIKEEGCAVKDAVGAGRIHQSRYNSYKEICEEISCLNSRRQY